MHGSASQARAPVLALHGLGGDSSDWHGLEQLLSLPVVTPDAPGHGGRGVGGDISFPAFATDALEMAGRAGFERFHVVGTSMGAATAMTLAVLAPSRVLSLALLCPAWFREPCPRNLRPLWRLGRLVTTHGLERVWDLMAGLPPVAGWSDAAVDRRRRAFLSSDRAALAQVLVELPGAVPLVPSRVDARPPILVQTWVDDPVHPRVLAGAIASEFDTVPVVLDRPTDRDEELLVIAGIVERHITETGPPEHRAGASERPATAKRHC